MTFEDWMIIRDAKAKLVETVRVLHRTGFTQSGLQHKDADALRDAITALKIAIQNN